MKARIYLSVIGLMTFFSLFVSCSKDDEGDTVRPVINLLEPEEDVALKIRGANGVHFEMDIADNETIVSYKINIHNNFDGHSYTRASGGGTTRPLAFERTYTDKAGRKQTHIHNHDIKIPADAAPGNYHLVIYCLDRSGNETHVAHNTVLSTTGDVESKHHRN